MYHRAMLDTDLLRIWREKLNISGGIYQEKLSCPKAFINLICRVSTTIKGPTKVVFFKADVKRSMQIALWITL